MSEGDVELVRKAIAAFNRGGVEEALDYFDPSVEWIGPPEWLEERLYEGHDGIRKVASLWTENFDDFQLELARVVDAGDHVVSLLYQRGRIKGSGAPIEQPLGYDWEIRDGKSTRVHVYFSWEQTLEAAGLSSE